MRVDGETTSDPVAIEKKMRATRRGVFEQGADKITEEAHNYWEEFGHLYPAKPEFWLRPLAGSDLWNAARAGPNTSPGLDGWAPAELCLLLGEKVHICLASILTMIEETGEWPKALLEVRGCAFQRRTPQSRRPLQVPSPPDVTSGI